MIILDGKIKKIHHIVVATNTEDFYDKVRDEIEVMQKRHLTAEIQYSTVFVKDTIVYSALMLGREVANG